jgi:hypothetical protein
MAPRWVSQELNPSYRPPLHLDPEMLSYLAERAEVCGISLNRLANELLKKGIELIEAAR